VCPIEEHETEINDHQRQSSAALNTGSDLLVRPPNRVEVMGRYLNRSDQGERIRQVLQIVPSGPSQAVPRTPKRVARRLEASKAAELVQGYLDGVPVDELADRFQVNPSTVQKHVRQKGLPRRSPRLGQAHIEEATQLYIADGSLANLGKHFGIGEAKGVDEPAQSEVDRGRSSIRPVHQPQIYPQESRLSP